MCTSRSPRPGSPESRRTPTLSAMEPMRTARPRSTWRDSAPTGPVGSAGRSPPHRPRRSTRGSGGGGGAGCAASLSPGLAPGRGCQRPRRAGAALGRCLPCARGGQTPTAACGSPEPGSTDPGGAGMPFQGWERGEKGKSPPPRRPPHGHAPGQPPWSGGGRGLPKLGLGAAGLSPAARREPGSDLGQPGAAAPPARSHSCCG